MGVEGGTLLTVSLHPWPEGGKKGGLVPGSPGSQGEQVGSALWKETFSFCPMVSPCFLGPNWPLSLARLSREHSTPASGRNPDAGKFQVIIDITNIPTRHQRPLWSPGLLPSLPSPSLPSSWPSPPLTLPGHTSGMGLRE